MDAEQEADPDAYSQCDECPVAMQIDGLCAVNKRAWKMYRRVLSRFAADTHAIPLVLHRVTADLDLDDFADLMDRFAILYDVLCPPPAGQGTD